MASEEPVELRSNAAPPPSSDPAGASSSTTTSKPPPRPPPADVDDNDDGESRPLMREVKEEHLEEGYQSIDDRRTVEDYHSRGLGPTNFQLLCILFARLAGWGGAALLIAVGAAEWLEHRTIDHLHLSAYIVSSYLIFFGLLFIFTDLTYFFLYKYFAFLFNYVGRGLAYIFTGSLCFGLAEDRYWPLGLAGGLIVCSLGVAFILIAVLFPNTPNPKPICATKRLN